MHRDIIGERKKKHVWLFHGSAAPPESLSDIASELAQRFCVHVPHFPGYGKTPYSPDNTLDQSLQELAAAITQIGEPVVLVGHSFGLYRAIRLLGLLDECFVAGLYGLAGSSTLTEDQREGFVQAEAWARAGEQIAPGLTARWFSPTYIAAHPEIIEVVDKWWAKCHIEAVARELFEPFDGGTANQILSSSSQPTMLRIGSLDVAVPTSHNRTIASLRQDIKIEVVENAGHFLHYEDKNSTLASLIGFISSCT